MALNKILSGDLSESNFLNYSKLSKKCCRKKELVEAIDKIIKEYSGRSDLNAMELYMLIIISRNNLNKVSNIVSLNSQMLDFEHNKLLSLPNLKHKNMQHRIFAWLDKIISGSELAVDLERTMPFIESNNIYATRLYLENKEWSLDIQLILDKSNDFMMGQVYFKNAVNSRNFDGISNYTLSSSYVFVNRINALYASDKEVLDRFINESFNLFLYDLPAWFSIIIEIVSEKSNAYNIYHVWYEIISNRASSIAFSESVNKHYNTLLDSKIYLDKLEFMVFRVLLDSFAGCIVPVLNGNQTDLDINYFDKVYDLMPQALACKYKILFSHLNPLSNGYSYAWNIFLKEKVEKKYNYYQCLNAFNKYYNLWPEFNESVNDDLSVTDYNEFIDFIKVLDEHHQEVELRQKFIDSLNKVIDDKGYEPDFKYFYKHSNSAGMQDIAQVYAHFFEQQIGVDNAHD